MSQARNAPVTAIGLMSGTSMDGIDAAVIQTDGHRLLKRFGGMTVPYEPAFRERLGEAVSAGEALDPSEEVALGDEFARLHASAIKKLDQTERPSLIGFHGHTLWHRPDKGLTRQIGNGALLAELTGIDVVNDLRSADMVAGGEGAPLASLYHAALAEPLERPLAVLNLGGVGNVTYLGDDQVLAFDTGPANAPLDDWVKKRLGRPFDRDGVLTAQGTPDDGLVDRWLSHPYFAAKPPKSLDRNDFPLDGLGGLETTDGAATLASFAVRSVVAALGHLPAAPRRWLVTGGGRRNPTLMALLANHLRVPVEPVEMVGWNGDTLEAEAFAFLAVRSRLGLPLTVPGTTGVGKPTCGGVFHPAPAHARRI
ncbi:MAG: anhydro-N-acetylmuramic acid kinase [Pseudomonadota bacterium]